MVVNKRFSDTESDSAASTEYDGSFRRRRSNNARKKSKSKLKPAEKEKSKSRGRMMGKTGKALSVGKKFQKSMNDIQGDATGDADYSGRTRSSVPMSNLTSNAISSSAHTFLKAGKAVMQLMTALIASIVPLLVMMSSLIMIILISFLCFLDEFDDSDEAESNNSIQIEVDEEYLTDGDLQWPVAGANGGTITSRFGPRWGRNHNGLDIACPTGTPIVAAEDGVVIKAGYNSSMGYYIKIQHDTTLSTIYMHNEYFAVSEGDEVKRGQIIAYSGNTGFSTGPHCHFGVIINGKFVDPEPYLGRD